jgi:hypothetical protein
MKCAESRTEARLFCILIQWCLKKKVEDWARERERERERERDEIRVHSK